MGSDEGFPRELSSFERELLLWVLPEGRPGYADARKIAKDLAVIGSGRRGEGNYILGKVGQQIDVESPLPPILAYGVVEGEQEVVTISVREPQAGQLEFELSRRPETVGNAGRREKRSWTYSNWMPGNPCPACAANVREVRFGVGQLVVLALCIRDQRIWVFSDQSGASLPIPVTSFYNELMLQKKIHDPAVALDSRRLFSELHSFGDAELVNAFTTYNRLRKRISLQEPLIATSDTGRGMFRRMMKALLMSKK